METPEQRILSLEMEDLIRPLILKATSNNLAVAGFVFGAEPPIMIRFGNTTETGPELAELYLSLSDIAEEKETEGNIIKRDIRS
jgi:hypothetical protein